MKYDIWKTMKNCSFVFTHQVNDIVENNHKIWIKEDKEKVQHGLKIKSIIIDVLNIDNSLRVSHCDIGKEMCDIFQLTHEDITEVKKRLELRQ